ncbi:MAG: hypothetical protein M3Q23_06505 [Actinomycetota bacterium]|nr:hypothetical protein [Actinomycetota bacterium]
MSLGLGVGDAAGAAAAADSPVPPGRHVGIGNPDGSGMGRDGRHVGMPLGKQVGTPDGMATGSDGRHVGTPPLGKHVGKPEGSGTGRDGRHVGIPPPDGAMLGGGALCDPEGGSVDCPGMGRLGRVRLGSGAGTSLDAAKVRPTGRASTTPRVITPASRTDRFLIPSLNPVST